MSRRPQRKVVDVVSVPAANRFLTTSVKFSLSKKTLSFPFSWRNETIVYHLVKDSRRWFFIREQEKKVICKPQGGVKILKEKVLK